jgi:hypothetical protein
MSPIKELLHKLIKQLNESNSNENLIKSMNTSVDSDAKSILNLVDDTISKYKTLIHVLRTGINDL